jgi:molecular chaperone GrpE
MTSSPRDLAAQNTKYQRDQEKLIKDLLGILDDLDRACEHWEQAAQQQVENKVIPIDCIQEQQSVTLLEDIDNLVPTKSPTKSMRQRLWSSLRWLFGTEATITTEDLTVVSELNQPLSEPPAESEINTKLSIASDVSEISEVVESAHEGVEMIRRSLLDILRKQQVVPLNVLGKPFDPTNMYALGRQESADAAENTVVQEVVRGYLWQNRILRESQVMVAMPPEASEASE